MIQRENETFKKLQILEILNVFSKSREILTTRDGIMIP